MLDFDLAELYGVTTSRLNQQVTRNRKRFPVIRKLSTHDKYFRVVFDELKKLTAGKSDLKATPESKL